MAIENKIDVTVVGYHGRKGPKDDPTIMGSAVQFMAQNSGSPILIVKDGLNR
jgi:nucleotide-binding universal stress UspA family protein